MEYEKKTELVILKHQWKKVDSPIKVKLNCKRLYPSKSIKYLGIKINKNFNWKQHIHNIAIMLINIHVFFIKKPHFFA